MPPLSEVNARAWCTVYSQRNCRNMFAVVFMATLSYRQRISSKDILAYPEVVRHSDKICKIVFSRSTHRRHTVVLA
ncbi:hypothetical protein PoB_003142100 [Plakobranchus ocellatus]|uniref:Uncharacterized protein n=1 Tax=Plakobranchus ocellatus TaxID=259542 RepID=A0AAV4A114_9GAST|nr:hypothetical protein PoB_003142100 [Plakobranchus ocellatus]